MITLIHKAGDYQSDRWEVDVRGVKSIERFNIDGIYSHFPRLRVTFADGEKVETDEAGMTIYEKDTTHDQ